VRAAKNSRSPDWCAAPGRLSDVLTKVRRVRERQVTSQAARSAPPSQRIAVLCVSKRSDAEGVAVDLRHDKTTNRPKRSVAKRPIVTGRDMSSTETSSVRHHIATKAGSAIVAIETVGTDEHHQPRCPVSISPGCLVR
jgi:hypothetical protein